MANAIRDENRVTTLMGVSSADGVTPIVVQVDPTTGAILVDVSGGASGDVSKVGTPVDNQVAVWTGDGTVEGTSGFTYDGSNLHVTGDIGITGTRITKGWFTDLEVTNAIAGSITGNAATVSTIAGLAPNTATTAASQPNITSVGSLISLTIADSGSITLQEALAFVGATGENQITIPDNVAVGLVIKDSSGGSVMTFKTADGFEQVESHVPFKAAGTLTVIGVTTLATSLTGLIRADSGVLSIDTDVTDLVSAASLTVAGKIEIATVTETNTGTDATRAVSPDGLDGWTGSAQVVTVGTLSSGNATAVVDASSVTVAGKVELATTAEIDTGTDSSRAMPVDQFVASDRNIRFINLRVVAAATDVATGTTIEGDFIAPFTGTIIQSDTDKDYFCAYNDTAGTTGTMVIDVHLNGTTIMTTNKLDIESTEKTTADATTQPDVTTTAITAGDIITIDVDAIHTTAAKGLTVRIPIRLT